MKLNCARHLGSPSFFLQAIVHHDLNLPHLPIRVHRLPPSMKAYYYSK